MQIKKQAMIDAIDTALKRDEVTQKRWQQTVEAADEMAKREYVEHNLAAMRRLRDVINAASKARRAVTRSDFFGALEVEDDDYALSRYNSRSRGPFAQVKPKYGSSAPHAVDREKLMSLKAALEAIVEDVITDNQLRTMGYSRIEWIFTAAVANS